MSEDSENKKNGLTVGGVSGNKKMRLGRVHKKSDKGEETGAAPAAAVTPAPAPAPAQEPVAPSPAVNFKLPEGPKEAPKPKLSQNRMSPENKARIRELNAQVAELKTLYNQGMITQEEYVAQRTELLQQMYSNS